MFNSIFSRLVVTALSVALLAAGGMTRVTGSALDAALSDAEKTKMRGFIYRVMGTMEVDENGAVNFDPDQIDISRNHHAMQVVKVSDQSGNMHTLITINGRDLKTVIPESFSGIPGEDEFSHDVENGVFRLSYTVTWVLADKQQRQLSLHYFVDDIAYNSTMRKFYSLFLAVLVAIFFGIIATNYFGIRWAVRPLVTVNEQLQALHKGKRSDIDVQLASELSPLLRSMNNVMTQERARQARFKNALADMAHTIKTPLAVIINEVESLDKTSASVLINEQLQRLNVIISQQLMRAAATGGGKIGKKTPISKIVTRITNALERLYPHVRVENTVLAHTATSLHEADAMDVFGNLIENAMKYGDDHVRIRACHVGNGVCRILIEDNGPGFQKASIDVLSRGVRADTTVEGQGIGLTLAVEILQHYGATLRLASSVELQGACVIIETQV